VLCYFPRALILKRCAARGGKVCREYYQSIFQQEVLGRTNRLLSLIWHGPHWKLRVQQFFYWRVSSSGIWRRVVRWACHLIACWFLLKLFLRPWRWRRYVPPKRRLQLNRLHRCENLKSYLEDHNHKLSTLETLFSQSQFTFLLFGSQFWGSVTIEILDRKRKNNEQYPTHTTGHCEAFFKLSAISLRFVWS
jgi:hypothetical protein